MKTKTMQDEMEFLFLYLFRGLIFIFLDLYFDNGLFYHIKDVSFSIHGLNLEGGSISWK